MPLAKSLPHCSISMPNCFISCYCFPEITAALHGCKQCFEVPSHLGLCCFISPCPDFGNPKITLCRHPVAQWKYAVVCLTLILWELALDGIIYLFFMFILEGKDMYQSSRVQSTTLYCLNSSCIYKVFWILPDSHEFPCLLRERYSIGGSQMEMNKLNLKSSFTSYWLVIWESTSMISSFLLKYQLSYSYHTFFLCKVMEEDVCKTVNH